MQSNSTTTSKPATQPPAKVQRLDEHSSVIMTTRSRTSRKSATAPVQRNPFLVSTPYPLSFPPYAANGSHPTQTAATLPCMEVRDLEEQQQPHIPNVDVLPLPQFHDLTTTTRNVFVPATPSPLGPPMRTRLTGFCAPPGSMAYQQRQPESMSVSDEQFLHIINDRMIQPSYLRPVRGDDRNLVSAIRRMTNDEDRKLVTSALVSMYKQWVQQDDSHTEIIRVMKEFETEQEILNQWRTASLKNAYQRILPLHE